jgi:hypothetical protein
MGKFRAIITGIGGYMPENKKFQFCFKVELSLTFC